MSLILLAGLASSPAHALDAHGFQVTAVDGDARSYTRLGYPSAGNAGDWDLGLTVDWADDPLAESLPTGRVPVLDTLGMTTIGGAYSLGGVRLDAQLPVALLGVDPQGAFTALGDARVGAMAPLLRETSLLPAIGLRTAAWAPTGDAARFVGAAGPRLGAEVVLAKEFDAGNLGRFGAIASAGARVGTRETVRNLRTGAGPLLGLGGAWRPSDHLSVTGELTAASDLGWASVPVEATLGSRVHLPWGGWATAGVASGLGGGVGAARARAFAGVGWGGRAPDPVLLAAQARQAAESAALAAAALSATSDRDGDGFLDRVDSCPDNPETLDGFTDDDGCPELDGDGDGVAFERDACPREPILEAQDPRHSDGCPHIAELAGDRIVITETIFFREGRAELLPSAESILAAVAEVLLAHPEIANILVEGHTNSNGNDLYNLRLSDARAFAVATWLGAHGVAPERLISKGYGETRALVQESHPDAAAINRRVEFKVVQVEGIPADARRIDPPDDVR
jgi:outer membrane protein OmpA-like peptidoglycan-associated protein